MRLSLHIGAFFDDLFPNSMILVLPGSTVFSFNHLGQLASGLYIAFGVGGISWLALLGI